MSANLILPLIAMLTLAQGPEPKAANDEAAARIAKSLAEVKKNGTPADKTKLLAEAGGVDDPKVANAVAPLIRDADADVRMAAVRALRYVKNERALERLMEAAKEREVRRDEELLTEVIYAMGQHGSPKALPALVDGVWSGTVNKALMARFLAIARIRDRASVETLIKLLDQGVAKGGPRNSYAGPVFRSLRLLTCRDLGEDVQVWKKWWKDEGGSFVVPAEPVGLDPKEAKAWERLWAPPSARVAWSPPGARPKDGKKPD
jgi:hypothetical protein